MKKNLFLATAVAVAGIAFTACGNNQKKTDADTIASDTIVETEETAAVEEPRYGASFFTDESKKTDAATDSTYTVTASGLKYAVVTEGTGKSPAATDIVEVHYTGHLLDGTVFDSSYNRGVPAEFPLNGVIKGWTEGLQLMKEGGRTVFYIPSDLAYGEAGAGGLIGPNQDLIFEVELLSVK